MVLPPIQTAAKHAAPRCGAKTRRGKPCAAPAVSGKKRCRMHGGAPGSGAPKGNRNALKDGYYTREERERRKAFNRAWRDFKRSIAINRKESRSQI